MAQYFFSFYFRFLVWFSIFIVATFPLYLIRFFVGPVPFSVPEVLILFLGLIYGIFLLIEFYLVRANIFYRIARRVSESFFFWRRKENPWWSFFSIPIFLLFLALGISFFITPDDFLKSALGIVKSWFVIPILYFFLFSRIVRNGRNVRIALDFYSVSALVLAGWGIWQWATGNYLTPDMRASGPFESANYLALFLAPACVYFFLRTWHLTIGDRKFFGIFYAVGVFISFFALYQTKSFGAFLGVAIAFVFYALYHWFFSFFRPDRPTAWKRFLCLFVGIFLVAGVFFFTSDRSKFDAMFQLFERSSSAVRLEVWQVSGRLIAENPVTGIGLGIYQNLYETRAAGILGRVPLEPSILHPHNLFVMFWLSTGVIGLLAFLYLLVLFFWTFWKNIPPERKRLASILFAMMIVLLVHGFVDLPVWKNDLALQFWLLVAAMNGLRKV